MNPSLRQRVGHLIAGSPTPARAQPIIAKAGGFGQFFRGGLGSDQPAQEILIRETLGVAAMADRAVANRLGSLDPLVKVSRRDGTGTISDETLDDHILKQLLDSPHPNFTTQQLLRLVGQFIGATGEAYWLKIRNNMQLPARLQPLSPTMVEPVIMVDVVESYIVTDGIGAEHRIAASEMIRFFWPDPATLYTSEGTLGPNSVNQDASKFAGEHLRSVYQNDATPPIVLKGTTDSAPPGDSQWDRWQSEWKRKYHTRRGTDARLPAKLPTGWDIIQLALESGADVAPLLEYWQVNQLMNYGVPASILGRVVSGDRSSAETNAFVFDSHTILPLATMIEQTLTRDLAQEFDASLFIEFDEFVGEDKTFELLKEGQDLDKKVRSVQQVLRDRNSDPDDAPWGEVPVGTFSDVPYTGEEDDTGPAPDDPTAFGVDEPPEDEPPDDEPRTRVLGDPREMAARELLKRREREFIPLIGRAFRKAFELQRRGAIKALEASQRQRANTVEAFDLVNFDLWERLLRSGVDPKVLKVFLQSGRQTLELLAAGQTLELTAQIRAELGIANTARARNTFQTTAKLLAKALTTGQSEGEDIKALSKRVNRVFNKRRKDSATIGRVEGGGASAQGDEAAASQSGTVKMRRWVDNRDDAVRDSHFSSQIADVPFGTPFTLASGNQASFPRDPALLPEDRINCRCTWIPIDPDFGPEDV